MPIREKPLKEDSTKKNILHAVLFPKSKYDLNGAKQWLKVHNYNYIHNRETKNFWRFRIKEQIKDYKFITITLNDGVELIYMRK